MCVFLKLNPAVGKNENKPIPITQDDDDDETLAPTELDLPSAEDKDEDAAPLEPRRSPRLNRINFISQVPASVSQQALHTFTANAFLQDIQWRMETKADPLNLEQVANGVVHSVTQETITKYKN